MTMKFNKCPVCGAGVVLEFPDGTFACDNEYCKSYQETDTTTYDLLIQSTKDLFVAQQALKKISDIRSNTEDYYGGVSVHYQQMVMDMDEIATKALEQIEHKDKNNG